MADARFDTDQLNQLAERAFVRPHVANALARYQRHTLRIARNERVLDPADERATLNPTSGSEDTLRAENERRRGELPELVTHLNVALKSSLTKNEQSRIKARAVQLKQFKANLGIGA